MPQVYKVGVQTYNNETTETAEVRYVVKNCNNILNIFHLSGIPRKGDSFPGNPYLTVRGYNIQPMNENEADGNYYVSVYYKSGANFAPEPPPTMTINWSIGLTSQRIYTDILGRNIGYKYLIRPGSNWEILTDREGNYLENPNAEMGVDVLIPTIEIEVNMPAGTVFQPIYVQSITGTVNKFPFTIGGVTFSPYYVLFHGAEANQSSQDGEHLISYRFTAGQSDLPSNVPKYLATPSGWQSYSSNICPLAYCYTTVYEGIQEPNNDNYRINDKPYAILLHQIYKEKDWGGLIP